MKKLSTLSLALCAAAGAMAQSSHAPVGRFFKPGAHLQIVANVLQQQMVPVAQKTTTLTERVIAESYYEQGGSGYDLVDTISYRYSGERPSHYNHLLFLYNSEYNPVTGISVNYLSVSAKPEMLYDSMTYLTNTGGTLQLEQTQSASYDANFNRTGFTNYNYVSGAINTGDRFVNVYTNGNLTESTWMVWNNATMSWDAQGKKYSAYNAQGKVVRDSLVDITGTPTAVQNNMYTYDANGKLVLLQFSVNGTPDIVQDMTFDYYSNGLLQRVLQHIDIGTGLIPFVRDTFAYAGSKNHCTLWQEYQLVDPGTGQFQGVVEFKKHINAQGMPDSATISQDNLGTWEPIAMAYTEYNSFDNPVRVDQYTYSGGSPLPTPDAIAYYYYEQYNNTAVKNVVAKQADMVAFPNPTTNILNLTWKDAKAGERVSIQLLNAVGQLVYSEGLNWMQPTEQINISNLPAGTYRLVVSDKAGAIMYQQAVVKQ